MQLKDSDRLVTNGLSVFLPMTVGPAGSGPGRYANLLMVDVWSIIASMNERMANLSREALARFCRSHHIQRMSVFGSILRDDFRPDSDVDVLVEFGPGRTP